MDLHSKEKLFDELVNGCRKLIASKSAREEVLQGICQLLADKVDYFDWVGFYLVDPERERQLLLGPYVGAHTDHDRIAFGQGICGQAADTEETFVIQDVRKEDNYLACSLDVRSEIVVPIFAKGKVVGELDIDSHRLAPFDDTDRNYLERICSDLAVLF